MCVAGIPASKEEANEKDDADSSEVDETSE
jgi:hypothetical protein